MTDLENGKSHSPDSEDHFRNLENGKRTSHTGQPDHNNEHPTWKKWIDQQFNWSWFAVTQSTGALAVLLSECPKQFHGLQTIGKIVFIFNIVMFVIFIGLLLARWTIRPSRIKNSFIDQPECFFFGSFWLSIATIILGLQRFAVPATGDWMLVTVRVLFWMYAAVSIGVATIHTAFVFQFSDITAIEMNPVWFLLALNAMLTGTVASTIAKTQPPEQRLPIIVAGIAYQGLGWLGSLAFFAWYFGSLFEKGWGPPASRPGLFMPVGPGGYTIVALIGNARAVPDGYAYFAAHPMAREVLMIVALWIGIFIWLFTFWICAMAAVISLASIAKRTDSGWQRQIDYKNTWWAMIFPNIGFTIGTIYIGQELQSEAILWVSVAMILVIVALWILDLVFMAKTIVVSLTRNPKVRLM